MGNNPLKLQKHIANLLKGKEAISRIPEKEKEAWWIQAHIHLYDVAKGGISAPSFDNPEEMLFVPIRRHLGPKRELALRFATIKKQKNDLERIERALLRASKPMPSTPPPEKKSTTITARKPYHLFLSLGGDEIWVGRNARDNEVMTFQLARGNDLWLHISGKSGAHLIIPRKKGKTLSQETIEDALQLALHYSGKLTSSEVIVADRKSVHKVRGKLGAVTLSAMKTLYAKKDEKRTVLLFEKKKSITPLF